MKKTTYGTTRDGDEWSVDFENEIDFEIRASDGTSTTAYLTEDDLENMLTAIKNKRAKS